MKITKEEFADRTKKITDTFISNCAYNIKTDNDDYQYVVDAHDIPLLIDMLIKAIEQGGGEVKNEQRLIEEIYFEYVPENYVGKFPSATIKLKKSQDTPRIRQQIKEMFIARNQEGRINLYCYEVEQGVEK